jgi:phytol kinase
MLNFLLNQLTKSILLFIIGYLGGLLVVNKGIKTNYTRKIFHFSLFFLPFFLDLFFLYNRNDPFLNTISVLSGLLFFFLFLKPIRERVNAFNIAFLCVDRPEDRPHTLLWIFTQTVVSMIVLISLNLYLIAINKRELIFIPILINAIGDGLAEPIGIRFGRHKYKTFALFTKKKYERSIEGSLCVFITSILVVLLSFPFFTSFQYIIALITIPISMTLAEAFAPHTWDNPFLCLIANFLIFFLLQIPI